jgi:receptor protein-tyrosine kinase
VGAYVHAERSPKLYVAQASLFINIPAARSTQEQLQGVQLSTELIKSYAIIATSRTTAERVKEQLGLPDSASSIANRVSARAFADTVVLVVAAIDTQPVRARLIAQATADVLNGVIADFEREHGRTDAVEARVIEAAATPRHPFSPRPGHSATIGMILGALVGIAVAAGMDGLDRSVKSKDETERLTGAPVLATIPRMRGVAQTPAVVADEPTSSGAEAYRALRTALRFLELDVPITTLVVTSAREGEGKTTTALNLAIALAQSGERVILVDADLRRGQLAEAMGLVGIPGLSDAVMRSVTLDEALQSWRDTLLVLPAGSTPPNPAEMLGSERMSMLIAELAARCDIVIVDTPPVLSVTDAVVLGAQADATMLVARHGTAQRAQLADSVKLLRGVGADFVGSVLNADPGHEKQSYYESRRPSLPGDRVPSQ